MKDDQKNKLHLVAASIEELRVILTCLLNGIADCSTELLTIADDLDEFHRGATIANVTGSSVGLAGGITTIVGLALAPFTAGVSLIISAVGAGLAAVAGLTGASASIADSVYMKKKCSRVEKIVKTVNAEMKAFAKASKKLDFLVTDIMAKQKKEDITNAASAGRKGVNAALEIRSMAKMSVAAARGVQIAARGILAVRVISGVFAALSVVVDTAFIVKGAMDIHNGCKTEKAAQIRECAEEIKNLRKEFQKLHEDLATNY